MCDTCDSDASNDCVQDCAGDWGGSNQSCVFEWSQSQSQAFYFFDSCSINGVPCSSDDWIVALNNKTAEGEVVGARQWTGAGTDVPVMGSDDSYMFEGAVLDCSSTGTCLYMAGDQAPTFAIWDHSELELVVNQAADIHSPYADFENLGIVSGNAIDIIDDCNDCLLYTSPSPRDS